MPDKPKSLIAGSTGLVGGLLLNDLSSSGESIVLISRKVNQFKATNTSEIVINFDDLLSSSFDLNEEIDHVYLCLGKKLFTYELGYMPKKNRDTFKKIDFDYPLAIAKLAFQNGAKSIAIVSAIGAKEGSLNYYFHIKGKLENAIRDIGFKNICIAQPGHLLGKRSDFRGHEIPFLEKALNVSAPLMQGPLKNFRQVEAKRVAEAMISELRKDYGRVKILRYKDF
mgnify:FL=1|tara:strand:+ start:1493 stop:2167 length:675 start_codon:yes stop_codon:yes gene_type:complete